MSATASVSSGLHPGPELLRPVGEGPGMSQPRHFGQNGRRPEQALTRH